MIPRRAWALVASLWVMAALSPSVARAATPDAEALFQDGRRHLASGNIREACGLFAESYAIKPSSGTLLNLALCHEELGQTATALAEYRRAEQLAREQRRDDRAVVAAQKADALAPTVPTIMFVSHEPVAGLAVATDGGTVHEVRTGMSEPIDPGKHELTVTAPGRRPASLSVMIAPRERRTLAVPELALEVARVGVGPAAAAAPTKSARPRADVYTGAAGGVLVIGGGVVWTVAYLRFRSAESACNSTSPCSLTDKDDRVSTIQDLEHLAVGAWVAGGALVVGSAIHHWWRGKHEASVALAPAGPGGVGLTIGGMF